jgi:CheY-like chemotaxis protein
VDVGELLRVAVEGVSREAGVGGACAVSLELLDGATGDPLPAGHAPVRVVVSERRLRQVVVALLSNGVRFNRPGGSVRVTARVRRRDDGHAPSRTGSAGSNDALVSRGGGGHDGVSCGAAELVVSVTDTGPGLPPGVMDRVESGEWATADADLSGSGLGLVLSRRLVSLMGGRLKLESPVTAAGGTRCEVTVPVAEVAEPERVHVIDVDEALSRGCGDHGASRPSSGSLGSTGRDSGGGEACAVELGAAHSGRGADDEKGSADRDAVVVVPLPSISPATPPPGPAGWRVLVLDDVPLNRRVVKRLLSRGPFEPLKFEFVEMATAEEAREELLSRGLRVDMAVVDENMSSAGGMMLGHELVELIRADERRRRVPRELRMLIVGATGNVTEHDLSQYRASGMDDVFGKPLPRSDEMFERLRATGKFSIEPGA